MISACPSPRKGAAVAANKLAKVFVVSRRDGSLVEKKFPMDQELYRAIKSLPKEEQIKYFTEEYYQWKEEQNDHRYLISSIDSFDEEYQFIHDIPDTAPNPEEAYVLKEKYELLWNAINGLSKQQKRIIIAMFYENKTSFELAEELSLSLNSLNHCLQRALAKLRKELERKI